MSGNAIDISVGLRHSARSRPVAASALFEAYSAAKHFPALDVLRGLAVMMVVAYHCPAFASPALALVQGAGDVGVDVFFVISGFLITTLILREQPDTLGRRLKRFYVRRVLRIVPLYVLAIVLYGARAAIAGDAKEWSAFAAFLPWLVTFCADVRLGMQPQPFPPLGIAWSLGIEEKFYLLWPVVAMCLSRRAVLRVGVCVIVAACIWRAWLAAEVATAGRLYYSCDTRVDGIMWGCVAACLLADRAWFGRVGAWMSSPVVAVAALVSLVLVAVGMENTEAARYVVVPVAACVLMMSVLMRSLDCRSSVLNALWIGWIGVVSYGIYLFHQPLIGVARRICGQETSAQVMLTCILAATLSVCVASVLYVCFERPFLRLKKRFAT